MSKKPPKPYERERWAFLCRSGLEDQVVAELGPGAAMIGEGIVLTHGRPRDIHHEAVRPIFASQAMRTDGTAIEPRAEPVANALAATLARAIGKRRDDPPTWTLEVVSPDSTRPRDPRRRLAAQIDGSLTEALDARLARTIADRYVDDPREAALLAQVWIVDETQALIGVTHTDDALSRSAPADSGVGRAALRARSGLKIQEALDWIGIGPDAGETCTDLGSGPGAWTTVVAERGAKVIAVDRAKSKIEPDPKWKIEVVHASPFEYAPEETSDWLMVHLAWRPMEVAQLVAKWGRRAWARQVVANFLLPMKQKLEAVREVIAVLEEAGWKGIKARQLHADGDEITLYAWLDPKQAVRGPQAPFRMRSEGAERLRSGEKPRVMAKTKPNRRNAPRERPAAEAPQRTLSKYEKAEVAAKRPKRPQDGREGRGEGREQVVRQPAHREDAPRARTRTEEAPRPRKAGIDRPKRTASDIFGGGGGARRAPARDEESAVPLWGAPRSAAPRGRGDAPRGRADAPRGRADAPRGRSDAPRGRSDAPRGRGRGDAPRGRVTAPRGRSGPAPRGRGGPRRAR